MKICSINLDVLRHPKKSFINLKNKIKKTVKNSYKKDAKVFAELLKSVEAENNEIHFGNFFLKYTKGVKSVIQYNNTDVDLLSNKHEYSFSIFSGSLELSLQLYENKNSHHRLFAYTKIGKKSGMTFSINLTTEKETENIIYLTQKIKFSEQFDGDETLVQ